MVHRLLATLVVIASAAGCAQPERDLAIPWPDTAHAEWVVHTLRESPLIRGTRITVETTPTGVGGYSGCNWYGMRRDSAGGVEMTARACLEPAGVMDQEQRFTSALGAAASAARAGDTLKVRDSAGSALLTLIRRNPTGADVSMLHDTAWSLRFSTRPGLDTTATIAFLADSVRGFGGCRDYLGTWSGQGDRLSVTSIAMQQLDCSDARRQRAEEEFTTVLSETSYFGLAGDELSLFTWGGDTVRLVRRR
jgi:heat shock protein HslJ